LSSSKFLTQLLEQNEPRPALAAHGWHPLPGGRLEYRDSGFAISMCNKPGCQPFHLFDPDGRVLASGYLLQPLKAYAEQGAADRSEFG
jgi:hypothetical protein